MEYSFHTRLDESTCPPIALLIESPPPPPLQAPQTPSPPPPPPSPPPSLPPGSSRDSVSHFLRKGGKWANVWREQRHL